MLTDCTQLDLVDIFAGFLVPAQILSGPRTEEREALSATALCITAIDVKSPFEKRARPRFGTRLSHLGQYSQSRTKGLRHSGAKRNALVRLRNTLRAGDRPRRVEQ